MVILVGAILCYEELGGSFVTVFHNPEPEGGGQIGS